jgi:hypothetical protein
MALGNSHGTSSTAVAGTRGNSVNPDEATDTFAFNFLPLYLGSPFPLAVCRLANHYVARCQAVEFLVLHI